MKHLGDITKINGSEVPLVDVITGGSPCQDLSLAGNRAGLSGERSGLFMEQIRIIKEMRKESERLLSIQKPNYDRRDIKPRYMVWENVQGAFSSNRGEDFRVVLEETAKIAEGSTIIPKPPEGKWSKAGCIMGNGWSIAWRLHSAEFWGVPQRRKRISLIADFGGSSSPEILFERKGLSWNTEQSKQEWEEAPRATSESIGRTSESTSYTLKIRGGSDTYIKPDGSIGTAGKGALIQKELSGTLGVSQDQTLFANCYSIDQRVCKSQFREPITIGHDFRSAKFTDDGITDPLTSTDYKEPMTMLLGTVVRRLTPLECERLQGFPDNWTNIGEWIDSKGKKHKDADSPRYKALGNSIALPFWDWMAERMCNKLREDGNNDLKMASLFDGIGGFPLVYQKHGCKPVWASEIEEFPIAVTKIRFKEESED